MESKFKPNPKVVANSKNYIANLESKDKAFRDYLKSKDKNDIQKKKSVAEQPSKIEKKQEIKEKDVIDEKKQPSEKKRINSNQQQFRKKRNYFNNDFNR